MKKFFLRLKSFSTSIFPVLVFVTAIVNLLVSLRLCVGMKPSYQYRTFIITNEVSSVSSALPSSAAATNSTSSLIGSILSRPSPVSSSDTSQKLPEDFSIPAPYEYSNLGNEPVARLYGRYYYEGETTSRGLILRIFPDRIYLHNGHYFVNTLQGADVKKPKGMNYDR